MKNSLTIKERREGKGSRKTDRGERLRKQSQSNAIEIAGNCMCRRGYVLSIKGSASRGG